MVPFSYSKEELSGLSALADFVSAKSVRRRRPREETGDHFEKEGLMADRCDAHGEFLFPSFAALFQGDHLGVEFALEAHQNLLVREGLLNEASRIRGHAPLPLPPLWEGLIIDDYFVIGSAGRCQPRESTSVFLHLAYAERPMPVMDFRAPLRRMWLLKISSKQRALRLIQGTALSHQGFAWLELHFQRGLGFPCFPYVQPSFQPFRQSLQSAFRLLGVSASLQEMFFSHCQGVLCFSINR